MKAEPKELRVICSNCASFPVCNRLDPNMEAIQGIQRTMLGEYNGDNSWELRDSLLEVVAKFCEFYRER